MRMWLLFFPVLLYSQAITNVRVLDVTAQQAKICYSAPFTAIPAQVEVSLNQSYSPVIPDVNGSLFSGANLDSRAGSVNHGAIRCMVIGRRDVEAALDSNNYSRSLAAYTTYYYRITSPPGSAIQATGSFTTATIPAGNAAGEPIPVDPNNPGKYLYGAMIDQSTGVAVAGGATLAAQRSAISTDPHTGARVRNMVLPGDLSTNNFLMGAMGDQGASQRCHPTPVQASNEAVMGYNCFVKLNGNYSALYWIAPSTGETRFLGVASSASVTHQYNVTWAWASLGGGPMFDTTTNTTAAANTFYILAAGAQSSGGTWLSSSHYLLKGVYTGHSVSGEDADVTNQNPTNGGTGMPNATITTVTPSDTFDRSFENLVNEFDPNWALYGQQCCARTGNAYADFVNGLIGLRWDVGQDNFGWVAMFDLNAHGSNGTTNPAPGCIDNYATTGNTYQGVLGCIVASTGTFTGGPGSVFRYQTLHSATGGIDTHSGMAPVSGNALRAQSQIDGVTRHYTVTLTNSGGLPGSASPCTMAQPPADSYIQNWPNGSYAAGCSTITVSGDPTLVPSSQPGYPATWPAAAGDMLSINSSTGDEILRLLDTGSDGHTFYVQRQMHPVGHGKSAYDSVSVGGTLDMLSPAYAATTWWDYTNGAKSTNYSNTYVDSNLVGHSAFNYNSTYGRWTLSDSASQVVQADNTQQGLESARFSNPVLTLKFPVFNGVSCVGNNSTTCSYESHPSLSVTNPSSQTVFGTSVNAIPYTGDYQLVQASNVTNVGGQLYRIRGAGSGSTSISGNYKLIPYFANSGANAMREVSGPSVQLATDSSNQYQWCFAYKAGECFSGSLAGDIYFNAPNVTATSCNNNWNPLLTVPFSQTDLAAASDGVTVSSASFGFNGYTNYVLHITGGAGWTPGYYPIVSVSSGSAVLASSPTGGVAQTKGAYTINVPNDICISPAWRWAQGVVTQQLGSSDPTGATMRTISNAVGAYEGQSIFWNARTLPDASWLFTNAASDGTIKLFQLPPYSADSVNRTAYVPVSVTIPPLGAGYSATVEFGYSSYGEGQFYCTARQDICSVSASTIQSTPFSFYSGDSVNVGKATSCVTGCTITIPAIPGRTIEWRYKTWTIGGLQYTSPMMTAVVNGSLMTQSVTSLTLATLSNQSLTTLSNTQLTSLIN